jgi:selenocysteine lyase/cysteine desulfurase
MLKEHYRRFLEARPKRLHFAAHSHHPWPDVTRDAMLQCWDDAARLADHKWEYIFGEVVPKAQAHLADLLGTESPGQIAFAANTHDFVVRLLSCFEEGRPRRVLTTDGEFHSFARQAARLEEDPRVRVTRVAAEPFSTFDARFAEAAATGEHDLVYLSHVFFNSGYVNEGLPGLLSAHRDRGTMIVVDGYHAVGALPVALAPLAGRIFYVGGGYKYLQSGEGLGFLHVPLGCTLRPAVTGWFSEFGSLAEQRPNRVAYADDGFRFWGATWDPTAAYRFNAVMGLWRREGVTPERLHGHAQSLQVRFLESLESKRPGALDAATLVTPRDLQRQGNFLTFRFEAAGELHAALRELEVETDLRGDRIRFGFGPYQDEADVDALLERLAKLSGVKR